ncbi:MAG: autotransporter domain-containing protein [Alphaproteobacteria bacterium]|nr:autotransporter domain-containing protein [Alphaproteobacteria bacterium]
MSPPVGVDVCLEGEMSMNFRRFKRTLLLSAAFIALSGPAGAYRLLSDLPLLQIYNLDEYAPVYGFESGIEAYAALTSIGEGGPIYRVGDEYYYWSVLTDSLEMNVDTTLGQKSYFLSEVIEPTDQINMGELFERTYGGTESTFGFSRYSFPAFSGLNTDEGRNVERNGFETKFGFEYWSGNLVYGQTDSDFLTNSPYFYSRMSILANVRSENITNSVYPSSPEYFFLMYNGNRNGADTLLFMNNYGAIGNASTLDLQHSAFLGNSAGRLITPGLTGIGGGGVIYNEGTINTDQNVFVANSYNAWESTDGDIYGFIYGVPDPTIYNRGGAVFNARDWISVNDQFFANWSNRGGAVYNASFGSLNIDTGLFVQNEAGYGGAIYLGLVDEYFSGERSLFGTGRTRRVDVSISNTSFAKNHAWYGGAVYNENDDLGAFRAISSSTFDGNEAYQNNGDIRSGGYGGAIYNYGPLELHQDRFFRNKAVGVDILGYGTGYGGAIYNTYSYNTYSDVLAFTPSGIGTLNIVSSEFGENEAYQGGAIYTAGGNITIYESGFYDNKAHDVGGAITIIGDDSFLELSGDKSAFVHIFDSFFSGNVMNTDAVAVANDIALLGSDVYLSLTDSGYALTSLEGGIYSDGSSSQIIDIAHVWNRVGTVSIGGTQNNTFKGSLNILGGILQMQAGAVGFDKAQWTIDNGSTLDVMQGTEAADYATYVLQLVDYSEFNVKLDLNAADGSSDVLDIYDVNGRGEPLVSVTKVSIAGQSGAFDNNGDQVDFIVLQDDGILAIDPRLAAESFDLETTVYKTESDALIASVNYDHVFYTHDYEGAALGYLDVTSSNMLSLIRDDSLISDWTETDKTPIGDTLALLNQTTQFSEKTFSFNRADTYTASAEPGDTSGIMNIVGTSGAVIDLSAVSPSIGFFSLINGAKINISDVKLVSNSGYAPVIYTDASDVAVTLSNVSFSGSSASDVDLYGGSLYLYGDVALNKGVYAENAQVNIYGAANSSNAVVQVADTGVLSIVNGGSLKVKAANLKSDNNIVNNGTLVLQTGTYSSSAITGDGTTEISGTVAVNASLGTKITVAEGNALSISAGNVGGAVTNTGMLTLSNGTLSKAISGTTGTTVINGSIIVNGVAIDNGITINSGKTLQTSADYIGGEVDNSGTITLTDGTLVKAISGTGSVIINGSVEANAAIANTITINNDKTLNISGDYLNNAVTAAGTLNLIGGTLAQEVTGAGSITVNGDVVISGNYNSFTGTAALNSGSLTLSGTTTFNQEVDVNAGTLELGQELLNANTVVFKSGSELNITVSNNDDAVTTGRVNAFDILTAEDGAILNIALENFTLRKGEKQTVTLLSAGSSITDNFTVTDGLRYAFERTGDGVYTITGVLSAGDVAGLVGGSSNNTAAADAWDNADTNDGAVGSDIAKELASLSADTSQGKKYLTALTALAPEEKPMVAAVSTENVHKVFNVVGSRLSALRQSSYGNTSANQMRRALQQVTDRGRSGGSRSNPNTFGSVWGQGLYNYAKFSGSQGFETNMAGGAVGADFGIGGFRLGFGSAYTAGTVDGYQRETDVKSYTGFLYAEYLTRAGFYINAAASYGLSEYDEEKKVLSTKVKGNYDVSTIGAQATVGWEFSGFSPEIGVRYAHFEQKKYTDTIGQTVGNTSGETITGVAGATISRSYKTGYKSFFEPSFRLGAAYDFKQDKMKNIVTLSNGSTYEVTGENLDKLSIETGLDLTFRSGKGEISLGYEGRFREHYQDHTGTLNFKYNF